nr:DUF6326 family protein [uncultured Celeribacter sp.]
MQVSTRDKLFVLWIFLYLNYLLCYVFTLFHELEQSRSLSGPAIGIVLPESFLLMFSLLLEMGVIMLLLTRLGSVRVARTGTLICSVFYLVLQLLTLLTPDLTPHYIFFSGVHVATLTALIYTASRWVERPKKPLRPVLGVEKSA